MRGSYLKPERPISGPLLCILLPGLLWSDAAHAHAGSHGSWWTPDPWVVIPMLFLILAYARGMQLLRRADGRRGAGPHRRAGTRRLSLAAFIGGTGALFLSLIWPLDALGDLSFAAHMTQHMVLIAVAAPLLVYAEPGIAVTRAVPLLRRPLRTSILRRTLRAALKPRVAFALHAAVIWGWHAPWLLELAVRNTFVHVLGHAAFFISALLFWTSLRQAGRAGNNGYGIAALGALGTMMHMGLLGGLLTFAPLPLYSVYADMHIDWLTPLEDQQLAGLIMWVPAAIPYLVAGLGFVLAWLRDAERHAPLLGARLESRPESRT